MCEQFLRVRIDFILGGADIDIHAVDETGGSKNFFLAVIVVFADPMGGFLSCAESFFEIGAIGRKFVDIRIKGKIPMKHHPVSLHEEGVAGCVDGEVIYHSLEVGKGYVHAYDADEGFIHVKRNDVGDKILVHVFVVVGWQPGGRTFQARQGKPADVFDVLRRVVVDGGQRRVRKAAVGIAYEKDAALCGEFRCIADISSDTAGGIFRLAQQDVPHGFRMLCQQGLVLEHVGMAIECVPCFLIAQVDSALDTAQCSIDL